MVGSDGAVIVHSPPDADTQLTVAFNRVSAKRWPADYLREPEKYWVDGYDWRACESEIEMDRWRGAQCRWLERAIDGDLQRSTQTGRSNLHLLTTTRFAAHYQDHSRRLGTSGKGRCSQTCSHR